MDSDGEIQFLVVGSQVINDNEKGGRDLAPKKKELTAQSAAAVIERRRAN